MILGRIILATEGEKHSLIRSTWLTKIFVTGDVICFFVQGLGGGMMAGDGKNRNLGKTIIIIGLVLQIILFGLFVITSVIFHSRMNKAPTQESFLAYIHWHKMLWVLYALCALIMVRNVFRVVEYIGGRDAYLFEHEWPSYTFDAIPMATGMGVLLFWYPTLIRPQKEKYALKTMESQPVSDEDVNHTAVRP